MVSTNQAMNIIRDAKGQMGSSFYTPVKNTRTGNNVMKHVVSVGMPAPNTGWGVDSGNAALSMLVGFVGAAGAFGAGRSFLKSQDGGEKANAKQRRRALMQGAVSLGAFALLSPVTYRWPLGGSPADERGPLDDIRDNR